MKIKALWIVASLLVALNICQAQIAKPCACCSESYQAFDFWMGDWHVYNAGGEIIGSNKIIKLQENCVLQENWIAADGKNTGTSYNYYNLKDSTWNQIWISNIGNVLSLKGSLNSKGEMVLRGELIQSARGEYYNQITWSHNKDGTVTQRWDVLSKDDHLITKSFEGVYVKK